MKSESELVADNKKGLVQTEVIPSLNSRNVASDSNAAVVSERIKKLKELEGDEKFEEIGAVAGLNQRSIENTIASGRISVRLTLAISEVLGISPLYLIGESQRRDYSRAETEKFLKRTNKDWILGGASELIVLEKCSGKLIRERIESLDVDSFEDIKSISREELADVIKAIVTKSKVDGDETILNLIRILALT